MMPQLGVLSSIHPDAALEVFNKDCLIYLGTCIAPIGKYIENKKLLNYKIKNNDNILEGTLSQGEIKLINLEENETGVSPGQACVFYSKNKFGDKVLGGGWIMKTINKYLST